VDGDQLLYIIASHRKQSSLGCIGVAGTLMTNFGFELAMKRCGIDFARAKVGDRYVLEMMARNGWDLGGESSGHIVCQNATTTGDGIISALQVLRALQERSLSLEEACCEMSMMPQVMINVPVVNRVDLDKDPHVLKAISQAEEKMAGKGRVLLRPSGTEPVIRVMVEGESKSEVHVLCSELAELVGKAVA
jgi:phosphoglucosamine mutase